MTYKRYSIVFLVILMMNISLYSMKINYNDAFIPAHKALDSKTTSSLIQAIENEDIQAVIQLCSEAPSSIISHDAQGTTLLMITAKKGHKVIAEVLVKALCSLKNTLATESKVDQHSNTVSLDAQDNEGNTALIIACTNGHRQIVQTLIAYGAKIALKNKLGTNALASALKTNNREMLIDLLEAFIKTITFQTKADLNQALLIASSLHCENYVKILIKHGADINTTDPEDNTPLLLTLSKSDYPLAKVLISLGADPNCTNKQRQTPLLLAISKLNKELVYVFMRAGANPNCKNKKGETPLILAIKNGLLDIVPLLIKLTTIIKDPHSTQDTALLLQEHEILEKAITYILSKKYSNIVMHRCLCAVSLCGSLSLAESLIKKCSDSNYKSENFHPPLHYAIDKEHLSMIEFFIKKGTFLTKEDDYGNSLLYSLRNKKFAAAHKLIELGAVINYITKKGDCALIAATEVGNYEFVKLCLDKGTPVDTAFMDITSLGLAAQKGYTEIMRLLLKAGADVNRTHSHKMTALHEAARNGHIEIVKELIKAHADINLKDSLNQYTPLMHAIRNHNYAIALLLIEAKADIHTVDNYRSTPLLLATHNNCKKLVEELLKQQAEINYKNSKEESALWIAVSKDYPEIIKILCRYGADIHIQGPFEETPLQGSVRYKSPEAQAILLKHGAKATTISAKVSYQATTELLNFATHSSIKDYLANPQTFFESSLTDLRTTNKYTRECNPDTHKINSCTHLTPLIIMSIFGTVDQVKTLLTFKAPEEERTTFLNDTMNSQEQETFLAKYLVSENYLSAQDKYGRTALHSAILYGNYLVAALLIKVGRLIIHIKDNNNRTPFDYIVIKYYDALESLYNDNYCSNNNEYAIKEKITILTSLLEALIHKGARITPSLINLLKQLTHPDYKNRYKSFLDEFIINMALRFRYRNDQNLSHNTEFLPDRPITLLN